MSTTLALPGAFAEWFSLSSVVQHDPTHSVYEGGIAVRRAWDARTVEEGSHILILDAEGDELIAALDCLDDYAEALASSALHERSQASAVYDNVEYREADRELQAARTTRKRIATLRDAL